ncbi:MAG: peptide ABC transporter substrate-binding protein [Candidatus Harrisonbacteria bacterium]|nr:peptide ABC transporter substrate-binding protein [Candidatus Harrisonbacteria bacterium]
MLKSIIGVYRSFSSPERTLFLTASTIFLLTLLVILTFWYRGATDLVPDHGGIFTEGVVGQPSAINPILSSASDIDRDLITLAFADLKVLAEEITGSEDGKEWTVVLKENLRWSDGEVLSVDDVLFTIALTQNRELASPLLASWKDVKTERVDDRTLVIKIPSTYAYFHHTLEGFRPLPQHIFSRIAPSNIRLSEYNTTPIGSGPYAVKSVERKSDGQIELIVFQSNPYYAGGEVYIDRFNVRFFSQFKDAFALLNRGVLSGLGGARIDHIEKNTKNISVYDYQIPRYYSIFFNQSAHEGLKDEAVRQALRAATDKKTIAKSLFGSYVQIIDGPLPEYIEGYDASVLKEKLSSSGAKKALEEAGWEQIDDIWKKDNIELKFELIVPEIDFLVETAQQLAQQWGKIGIVVETIVLSPTDINEEIIKTRNYQMLLFGNILRGNADIFSFWHSSQRFHPGLNLALYQNEDIDEALLESRSTLDEQERAKTLSLIQSQIHSDIPAIFLYSPDYIYLVNENVRGIQSDIITSPSNRFDGVSGWHLETKRTFSF